MVRSAATVALSVLALGAGAVLARPAAAASQIYLYEVEHPTYGNIGTYTNIVERSGDDVEVRTKIHIAVKILGIRLFHQDAERTEKWAKGRLVSFQSDTDDNGKKIDVDGKAEDGRFVIHAPSGQIAAPPQVHPSNPWAPQVLDTDMMMSSKTGQVLPVVVTDKGAMPTTFDGHTMRLREFAIDSDKHQIVWVDDRGVVEAFQTEERGAKINFVLKHPLQTASDHHAADQ
jgi:Domain of unknown function (DUF6134)